ncbi:hypothetical protein [Solimicrobium silvestre]|uniref:Antimicrobial peptide resistance and lipid A acylation protein PagP n=1 Tax=Solimicrobium silvestre TaxID=2099400 RepID=A0A2S9H1D3_9BURK|nr:hypothetical protein [Solimicrobium silvestre]PRC93795.1 Antimicrobial peptide resistance and lipid A acylation protein PagP [Solimicrobium silvestre]
MKFFTLRHFSAVLFLSFACSAYAQTSDTAPAPANTDTTTEQPGWFKKTYDDAVNTTENLYDNGRLSTILSGYAHHGRGTYTAERIDELNEKTWGLGMSKELRDSKDNEESLQIVIMADSHYKPQITAGYSYQWMKSLGGNWEAGIGYTAGLISRTDILQGVPFPGILPLFSIGTRDTKLVASYIPKLSGTGNGDVLFLALRVSLK